MMYKCFKYETCVLELKMFLQSKKDKQIDKLSLSTLIVQLCEITLKKIQNAPYSVVAGIRETSDM